MAPLAPGDESSFGVARVQASARHLEKVPDSAAEEVAKRWKSWRGYADDVIEYCNPAQNPASFRKCQNAAQPAVEGLLILATCVASQEIRTTALTALGCISFTNLENASNIVTSQLFWPMLKQCLRPIVEIRQQEEILACLQLVQAICAVAPEAPVLSPMLPIVVALLAGQQEGRAACNAVRLTALEILVSCSLSNQRRSNLTSLLPESVLMTLMTDAESNGTAMVFPLGLLLANLSDLSDFSSKGSKLSQTFWDKTGFLGDLRCCLSAALDAEPWPPQSGVYHTPWKLANTYLRLSRAGLRDELRGSVAPLIALVERRAGHMNSLSSDDARASRLAAEVLRELTADTEAMAQMRLSERLPEALASMQGEELAAQELMQCLATEWPTPPDTAAASCDFLQTKPW